MSELDRKWNQIQEAGPDLGVRNLFSFAHGAAEAGTHAAEIAEAYRIAIELQDRDPDSPTHGNFRWYRKNETPQDLNAVEFCTAVGVLTWNEYRERLSDTARDLLEDILRMNAIGIRGHKVLVTYTNIFLKKSWNSIALGEALQMDDLAQEGYELFEEWCDYTAANGFHEYLSPTYYSVDLDSLEKIACRAGRTIERDSAEKALRHIWSDIGANWFDPGNRLGGAHSRDYDYLTGRSDRLGSRLERMLAGQPSEEGHVASEDLIASVCKLRESTPRMVCQSWGHEQGQTASQYVGMSFSLGSACRSRHNMDKVLTVNFAEPETVMMNLIMDGRGDPYGVSPVTEKDGHTKSRHLVPFVASVQNQAEVLAVFSAGPETWAPLIEPRGNQAPNPLQTTGLSFDASGMPTRLLSHLVLPLSASLWFGEEQIPIPSEPTSILVPDEKLILVEVGETLVAIRTLYAARVDGDRAKLELVVDKTGLEHGATRLTWTHADTEPNGRGTLAIWIRVAEADDRETLREDDNFTSEVTVEDETIDVCVEAANGGMRIVANLEKGDRIQLGGSDPTLEGAVLSVNGKDIGKEIWS
jgi:hypothetical protein